MAGGDQAGDELQGRILDVVRRYWGVDQLWPLQEEAIRAGVEQRDSLVVLPTGGGKSLCYQVPPLLADRTDIVISPLISLMKDQVDALRACGYPAATLHSGMTPQERSRTEAQIAAGKCRLVFVAPERVLSPWFQQTIERLGVRAFAVDEAHCISHWGHDFRPEYRQLATLKERFPGASVHGYTATATERVRADIVEQLQLEEPALLVGCFDRPNLVYRVVPRVDRRAQVLDVIGRHQGEAVIVYCISRKDTEQMATALQAKGVRAAAYHAGMDAADRRRTQDAFAAESLDVVVATVAFGMGIDRSNVRCVIHAAMPKSVEHYQQETGRAGRDGLEAECVLFYSAADAIRWESLIRKSAQEANAPQEVIEASRQLLDQMRRYCTGLVCRHRALSEHFGQSYERPDCQACDICLNEVEGVADATVNAQKILSCVARVQQRFGVGHVVDVLRGADTERVRGWNHDKLSTFGLMKDVSAKSVQSMVYQLVDQGLLDRTGDELPVLMLNEASWSVLRGQRDVRLIRPKKKAAKTRVDTESWEGVDRGLFERLRDVRRELAAQRGVPPYVIFNDATLRDLGRIRPGSLNVLACARGVGQKKLADFGPRFLEEIQTYCRQHGLELDTSTDAAAPPPRREHKPTKDSLAAAKLFARGCSIEEVMANLGRARSTIIGYLGDYIESRHPQSIDRWIDPQVYGLVADAAREVGTRYLRPIFERLDARVPYDTIRLVATHLEASGNAAGPP